MIDKGYIQQLEKRYPQYLIDWILGAPFSPISLRGGKNKPGNSAALYNAIDSFQKYEKREGSLGWHIEWELWHSSKLGNQKWPTSILVNTEEDYLFLVGKQKEAVLFKRLASQLLGWKVELKGWLVESPQKVLEYKAHWESICAVVDYLLSHDVQQYYVRSLPVPVNTKFIQQFQGIILSILKHLQPERFPQNVKTLEVALGLQTKPLLFLLRWLDPALANQYTSGIEILSVPVTNLQNSSWDVREVWVVENETNLYLLPKRKDALVIFSKGYALHDLINIPLFQKVRLFYWGDLDEDGFIMLHQFRQYYPHVQSVLMDVDTATFHLEEMVKQPFRLQQNHLQLTPSEEGAYHLLLQRSGRIEQEKLKQDYMQAYLERLTL